MIGNIGCSTMDRTCTKSVSKIVGRHKLVLICVLVVLLVSGLPLRVLGIRYHVGSDRAEDLDMFPPPHNVTLNVEGYDVVLIGEDLDERMEQHLPNLLDNDTVAQAIGPYADILLFIDEKPQDRYALLVGMNNSHYVEIMLTYASYELGNLTDLQAIEVLSSEEHLTSLKTVLATAMHENETRNLNLNAWNDSGPGGWSALRPYLWSYNYTGESFSFGEMHSSSIVWQHPDHSYLLPQLHWEIKTTLRTSQIVGLLFNHKTIQVSVETILSVTMDGELIQVLKMFPPPVFGYLGQPGITLLLAVGSIVLVGAVATIVVFRRRRSC